MNRLDLYSQKLLKAEFTKYVNKRANYGEITPEMLAHFEVNAAEVERHNKEVNQELRNEYDRIKNDMLRVFGSDSKIYKYVSSYPKDNWPISYHQMSSVESYKQFLYDYERWKEEQVQIQAREDRTKQLENKKKLLELHVVVLAVKYSLPIDTEFYELYENLIRRNRYLNLATAAEDTRNDWSNGFYAVENALDDFIEEVNRINKANNNVVVAHINSPTESELAMSLDFKIIDLYNSVLDDNDESDGRVFRDIEYDYGFLYNKASETDKELVDDVLLLRKLHYGY